MPQLLVTKALVLGVALIVAFIAGVAAGVLMRLAGTHPATSVVAGGSAFAGTLAIEMTVLLTMDSL